MKDERRATKRRGIIEIIVCFLSLSLFLSLASFFSTFRASTCKRNVNGDENNRSLVRDITKRRRSCFSFLSFLFFFFFFLSANKSFFTIGPSRGLRNCRLRLCGYCRECAFVAQETRQGYWNSSHPPKRRIGKIFCRGRTVSAWIEEKEKNLALSPSVFF